MAEAVYILCTLTSLGCAWLLLRAYQRSRTALLFWASVCFAGLGINSVLLVIDLVILPTTIDLSLHRASVGLVSLLLFVWGLITSDHGAER
jgi:hypothetical protein